MSIKECKKTFCDKYAKQKINDEKKYLKTFYLTPTQKKNDKTKEHYKQIIKQINTKEYLDKIKKKCYLKYCNPKCIGTLFENGNNISDEYIKTFNEELTITKSDKQQFKKDPFYSENVYKKFKKGLLNSVKKQRKKLFGDKKTVLNKDSFYIDFNNSDKIKKRGAISGCSIMFS